MICVDTSVVSLLHSSLTECSVVVKVKVHLSNLELSLLFIIVILMRMLVSKYKQCWYVIHYVDNKQASRSIWKLQYGNSLTMGTENSKITTWQNSVNATDNDLANSVNTAKND